MRRNHALRLLAVLTALTVAAVSGAPAVADTAPAPRVAVTEGSLRLEAMALQQSYGLGKTVVIEVTATNTGQTDLEYWLPTPCQSPFTVSVQIAAGSESLVLPREADLGREPMACIQVLKRLIIGPGQAITERFAWDTRTGGTVPGTYTAAVRFSPYSMSDAKTPAVYLPVQIDGLTDVQGHWAEQMIMQGARLGIISGYPGGSFRPENRVTRAEFIKMLVRARGLEPLAEPASDFADVDGHWVAVQGYLQAAVAEQLLHPADYGERLGPDVVIDRQEAAAMAVRTLGRESLALMGAGAQLRYSDRNEIAAWAAGYVEIADVAGIVRGYTDGRFQPARAVTRAEAATMVLRLIDALSPGIGG